MEDLYFVIHGQPKGKARPRVTRYGTYTPKSTREFEALIRKCWQEQTGGKSFPAGTALCCTIHAYFAIPQSYSKRQRQSLVFQPHTKKPDCDNIAKAVLDSLNGYAFHDDSAVAQLIVEKTYTDLSPYIGVSLSDVFVGVD